MVQAEAAFSFKDYLRAASFYAKVNLLFKFTILVSLVCYIYAGTSFAFVTLDYLKVIVLPLVILINIYLVVDWTLMPINF